MSEQPATTVSVTATASLPRLRIRIFVDFWNFSLELRNRNSSFMTDWTKIGPLFTHEAAALIDGGAAPVYEAMHVYGSFDPNKPNDAKLKNWFTNKLDKMPGIHVALLERQRKRNSPKCPSCQTEVPICHACGADMRGTEEKGVDTRIVADIDRKSVV